MTDMFAIATGVLALAISVVTAWLTFFYRGRVQMTAPSMVILSYDQHGSTNKFDPKIMIRSLLFSTGERGYMIESLYVRLRQGTSQYLFPIWGLNADNKMVRGGGLYVSKIGVTAWHYFNASTKNDFRFESPAYHCELFARIHGKTRPQLLWSSALLIPASATLTKHDGSESLWYDMDPESHELCPHLEKRRELDVLS